MGVDGVGGVDATSTHVNTDVGGVDAEVIKTNMC